MDRVSRDDFLFVAFLMLSTAFIIASVALDQGGMFIVGIGYSLAAGYVVVRGRND